MVDTSTRYAIRTLVFLISGPLCWAAHLTLIYGAQSPLCALGIGETAGGHNGLVVAVIIAGTVLLGGMALASAQWAREWHRLLAGGPLADDSATFLLTAMRLLVALSVLAMIYAALTSLVLPACAPLR